MDTSGGNSLELLELEKQLMDKEEEFRDSLVDDSIQNLSDQNERAAE
jgi:hypothetical protein